MDEYLKKYNPLTNSIRIIEIKFIKCLLSITGYTQIGEKIILQFQSLQLLPVPEAVRKALLVVYNIPQGHD